VRLTDEQKTTAKALGLTYTEMTVALATHIAPETYALHKQEMQASRDAWDAKLGGLAEYAADRLKQEREQRPDADTPKTGIPEESARYLGRLPIEDD